MAKEISENQGYQDYLIRVKTVDKDQIVEVARAQANAEALSKADLKLLVNSGDVHSGLNKLSDIFTAKGGSQVDVFVLFDFFSAFVDRNIGHRLVCNVSHLFFNFNYLLLCNSF